MYTRELTKLNNMNSEMLKDLDNLCDEIKYKNNIKHKDHDLVCKIAKESVHNEMNEYRKQILNEVKTMIDAVSNKDYQQSIL